MAEQSESIKNLVESISNQQVALPEFQRDFVWDVSKTYDLFDSIIRDIFIGAIIYGKPSFEIAVREIDNRPRKGKGKNRKLQISKFSKDEIENKVKLENYRIILDGQQRATSIYRALTGIDNVWFIAKNENDADYVDDELMDKPLSNKSLEDILFEISGEQDNERISVRLSDVFKIMQSNLRESKIDKNIFSKQIFQGYEESDYDNAFEKYLTLCDKLQDVLKESKLLNYYLLNMDVDKFTLFFERSNSRGVNLKFTDILAAKLYAGDFNLRDKIDEFKDQNPDIGNNFNQELIVRTIAYIEGDGRQKIDKSFILKELNYTHFGEHWDEICDFYKETLNFLFDNHYIISQSWMPYENMLLPLMIFRKEIGKDFSQITHEQAQFIQYWYWASIFAQRYTGSSNEVIIKDSNYLKLIARNERIPEKTYFNRLARININKKEDFYDYSSKASAVYKGILNLINFHSKGLVSWENNNHLNFNDNRLEDHHIFPKNYVKKKYKDDLEAQEKMASAVNRTLIPKITNIRFSDKAPSKYMKDLEKNNPNFKQSLEQHLIPLDILEMDELFMEMLDERANRLFQVLQNLLVGKQDWILSNFYKEKEVSSNPNIKIFGTYHKKRTSALFNIDTQKVIYQDEEYTPSRSALKAKEDLTGKQLATTNGWDFWKYINQDGEEKFIKELRD